jgi:hypothetical protein
MDVGFNRAARKRFNIKLDHSISSDGFLKLDNGETLVRLGLSLNDSCNSIALRNTLHFVAYIPSFSVFIRQGLKDFLISQNCDFQDFKVFDVFIEEEVGPELFIEVVTEIDLVSVFSFNGKVVFIRAEDYTFSFDTHPRIVSAKLFKVKEYAVVLFQMMLVRNDHLENVFVQFPLESVEVPERKSWLLVYNRLHVSYSSRMIMNEIGELSIPGSEEEDFWDNIEF